MTSLVSLLIPNFNKALYLRETLDSILVQTYANWECIVVDDGSTDDSFEILTEYSVRDSRFRVFRRPASIPKGACSCRNYAFSLARGEFVNWFDSDDLMNPKFLEIKTNEIVHLPYKSVVVSRIVPFGEDTRGIFVKEQIPQVRCLKVDYLLGIIHYHTAGPIFRKIDLENQDLFDVRLKVGQEKEFFYRLILNKFEFKVLSEPLVYYRTVPGSILDVHAGKPPAIVNQAHMLFMLRSGIDLLAFDRELVLFYKRKLYLIGKIYLRQRDLKYFWIWLYVSLKLLPKVIFKAA